MSKLKLFKEAIRGSHDRDFTQGPIGTALVLLAVPMVLETLLESLFAVVDIFFVAHLGADAVATVGLTESVMTLVYSMAMGLGVGATALVARRIGEKDPEAAAHTAAQAIMLGILIAVPLGIICAMLAPAILGMLGASAEVRSSGAMFARIELGANVVVVLLFLINAIFRGAGDAAIAMRSLWLASACNMVFGPLLIFGVGPLPRLGLTGAAVGTTLGRSIGVLYQVSQLRRRDGRIVIKKHHWKLDPPLMKTVLKLSGSATFQMLIGSTNWIALIRILSGFGSIVLAGYTIAIRVVIFALMPSWGLSNAGATLVGQNLGAKQPDRAERSIWLAGFYNMLVLGGVGLVFTLAATPIVHIFTADPEIVPWGVRALRIISLGFVFYAWGMVLSNAFNGAGDTWTPTWLNLFIFWLLEIPLAWGLSKVPSVGPNGVFWAVAIAFSVYAVVSAVLFKRGRWKTRVV